MPITVVLMLVLPMMIMIGVDNDMSTDGDWHHAADHHHPAGGRSRKLHPTEQSTALLGSRDQVLGEAPDDGIV